MRDTTSTGTLLLLDALAGTARLFTTPERILSCTRLEEIPSVLEAAEHAAAQGHHCAGYLAYEAGFAFEEKLRAPPFTPPAVPLVWFGVYGPPQELSREAALAALTAAPTRQNSEDAPSGLRLDGFDMTREAYAQAFAAIRDHLAKGDIYQANLTMRGRGTWHGDPAMLFRRLIAAQPVGHAAFLDLGSHSVLSLSPELFLERQGARLQSRPMKGTAPRGSDPAEDRTIAAELAADEKSRAENMMIVDLMRNDISRICDPGSVQVPKLLEVERYRTLFQMTSTVEGRVTPGTGFAACMARLFPCGSITGAPKLRAMEILRQLETGPRGIYTGSIGCLEPSGDFRFNVAIRTLVAARDGSFEIGTGSGLVFDSRSEPEYEECRLKLTFLERSAPDFALFETMAWHPDDGYLLLERHLGRLEDSAAQLGFVCPPGAIRAALAQRAAHFDAARRVRVQLEPDGRFSVTDAALAPTPPRWRAVLAESPVEAPLPLLRHKTTARAHYDETRTRLAADTCCDEVLFFNADGFLTEGSISNLFIARGGHLLTPALRHGLLPGTLRAALLDSRRAHEADLTAADLARADRIYFGNSVRGLVATDIQSRDGVETGRTSADTSVDAPSGQGNTSSSGQSTFMRRAFSA